MAFRYEILPPQRLIIERFSGPIGFREVVEAMELVWADERYDRTYDGICDLSQAMTGEHVKEDVAALQQFFMSRNERSTGRWAIIVHDPLMTALTMIYSQNTTMAMSIFSTWSTACCHLNVEVPANVLD